MLRIGSLFLIKKNLQQIRKFSRKELLNMHAGFGQTSGHWKFESHLGNALSTKTNIYWRI